MPGTTNCRRRATTKALTHSLNGQGPAGTCTRSSRSKEEEGGLERRRDRLREGDPVHRIGTFTLKDERADPVILSAAIDHGRPRAESGCCSMLLFWRQELCTQAGRLIILVSTKHCDSDNYERLIWHICTPWLPCNARILQDLSTISELAR